MNKTFLAAAMLCTGLLGFFQNLQALPNTLHWQGKIYVQTLAFNGVGQFKFLLHDGSNCLWSNTEGSACSALTQPSTAVTRNLVQGLYTVDLGDTAITNMASIPSTTFTGSAVYLRIWFNDGSNGFQLLSPDEKLSAVPFAMFSNSVGTANVAQAVPRMTTTQRDAISSPASGMLVFNTTTSELNIHNGASWVNVASAVSNSNSYIRMTNGLTRPSAGNTNIINYATLAESSGTDITYVQSVSNSGDSFLINTSGIYAVTSTGLSGTGYGSEIRVGSALDNLSMDSKTRTRVGMPGGSTATLSWVGYIAAGNRVWRTMDQAPAGAESLNQITITKLNLSGSGNSQWSNNGLNIYYTTGNVGIGTSNPNSSAALDVSSTTKGFLPPRMTTAQRNAISSPATGTVIFNTDTTAINYRTASGWQAVSTGNVSGLFAKEYGFFTLSANQSTNLTAGTDHIKFANVAGNIALDTSTYQTSGTTGLGRITLRAGRTYQLMGVSRAVYTGSSGYVQVKWYNLTNSAYIGTRQANLSVTMPSDADSGGPAFAVITPATDIVVELRLLNSVAPSLIEADTSYAYIESIDAYSVPGYLPNNGGTLGGDLTVQGELNINSTTKAFLPPRMTTTQRNAIASPAQGMMIYNTSSKNINVHDGSNWAAINPPGSMMMFAGPVAPAGYLICNGAAVSRTTYAALFAVIGTTYGVGDGSTTFNLPDMQGRAPAGVGTSSGGTDVTHVAETVSLGTKSNDMMQGHRTQSISTYVKSGGGGSYNLSTAAGTDQSNAAVVSTIITDGTNGTPRVGLVTKGKTLGVNFIIKY